MAKKLKRRDFLKIAGAAALAVSAAGVLSGCEEEPASSSSRPGSAASSGSTSGAGTSTGASSSPASSGASSASSKIESEEAEPFMVEGIVTQSENFKIEDKVFVDFAIGEKYISVTGNRTFTNNYDGKIQTNKLHSVLNYTLSGPVQKVQRLGKKLGDSVIFYVPSGTLVTMSYKESDTNGNAHSTQEFQWVKTNKLKTEDELTVLGDAGKISSGRQVAITSGGMYQFCWANEGDSYAVMGNIVLSVL